MQQPQSSPVEVPLEWLSHETIQNVVAQQTVDDWYNASLEKSMVVDSGTTSHISTSDDADYFIYTGEPSTKIFCVANGNKQAATEKRLLPYQLRPEATDVHVSPGIVTSSLLSTGKLAHADYTTILSNGKVEIYDATKTKITTSMEPIISGWQDPVTSLHHIPLVPKHLITDLDTQTIICGRPPTEQLPNRPPPSEACHNVYELRTKAELLRFYHAAAGFPTQKTWERAIKRGFYASWPGLTVELVRKHFPESEETQKGHMKAQKSGIRSTKKKLVNPTIKIEGEDEDDTAPTSKQRDIHVKVWDTDDELQMKIFTDQTGSFPKTSVRGYKYIMVLAEVDSNAILVEPMRNRSSREMTRAYQTLIKRLNKAGIHPKLHILDNETSDELVEAIESNNMKYQYVPPHNHRRNLAERAIQTFKAHFISTLCGVDENFPISLWCHLLPQVEMTLNMLRPSRTTPNVSAYAHLHGQHDYNAHPIAPLGMQCEMHVAPNERETFAPHSVSGYSIGTSFEHYRCYNVYVKNTRRVRIGNTVFFKHKYLTMPTITNGDALLTSAENMITAMKGGIPQDSQITAAYKAILAIYSENALAQKEEENAANSQRVRMDKARAQRVQQELKHALAASKEEASAQRVEAKKAAEVESNVQAMHKHLTSKATAQAPPLEVEYPTTTDDDEHDNIVSFDAHPPLITQDEEIWREDRPSRNTRARSAARSITQEAILTTIELSHSATNITAQQAAARKYPLAFLCDVANAVLDGESGEMLEYRHLIKHPKYKETWGNSYGNEVGSLAQGRDKTGIKGTDTLFFIPYNDIPLDRRSHIKNDRTVCTVRPEKDDPNRTRITFAGSNMHSPIDCGTPTASLITVKLLFNSVISAPGAKFMGIDISNFYLNTPMERFEYMRMKLDSFPPDIIEQYNLRELANSKGYVHCEVRKGMYGLPAAGILAQKLLEERLGKAGYHQSKYTPGLWTHEWRPISFALIVDDFAVKYVGDEHAQHLLKTINKDYKCKADWKGRRYAGLTLDWDYENREVHISMPGYVHEALQRFNHLHPKKPQHQPHKHVAKVYGQRIQYAQVDESKPLDDKDKKFIQQVTGTFLFYARAVDPTMLVTLSAIASAQANPTQETMNKCKQFLDYAATHPDAIITYRSSDMVLSVHSDASYLTEPNARSRAGGHFVMSRDIPVPPNNGAVLNISQIIKAVVSSSAEAEVTAAFVNSKEAVPMRITLLELGHPQPPTPVQLDNTTALGFIKNNIKAKGSKSWDMKLHWLRDREAREQFNFFWRPGPTNDGDPYTKFFSGSDHENKRPDILTDVSILNALRRRQGLEPAVFTSSERVC